jgi:hypothetical protein
VVGCGNVTGAEGCSVYVSEVQRDCW